MINDVEPQPVMLSSKKPHRPIKGEGELEILDLIAEIINVTLSADEIYDALVNDICRVFGVEICAIILLNEEKVDLVVEQYHHQETLRYYWETTDLEGGPIEYCIANKEVVINNHITHDVDLAVVYANRILLLSEGKLVSDGSPQEVMGDEDMLNRCRVLSTSLLDINLKHFPQTGRFMRAEELAHVL